MCESIVDSSAIWLIAVRKGKEKDEREIGTVSRDNCFWFNHVEAANIKEEAEDSRGIRKPL